MISTELRRAGIELLPDGFPRALEIVVGNLEGVLAESDAVLAVSGTVTLDVARFRRPMIVVYRVGRWSWRLVGRWIVRTRTFALPNLISEAMGHGRVVPEFVPHFGMDGVAVGEVVEEVGHLLESAAARDAQRAGLERVCAAFEGMSFRERAADVFLNVVES
jgi:lipid-A-disaccharide synthase